MKHQKLYSTKFKKKKKNLICSVKFLTDFAKFTWVSFDDESAGLAALSRTSRGTSRVQHDPAAPFSM